MQENGYFGENWLSNLSAMQKKAPHRGAFFSLGLVRLVCSFMLSLLLHMLLLQISFNVLWTGKTRSLEESHTDGKIFVLLALHSMNASSSTSFEYVFPEVQKEASIKTINNTPTEAVANTQNQHEEKGAVSAKEIQMLRKEPHYYSRNEVDHPARMIESLIAKNGLLDEALIDYNERGSVELELWINETGGIDKAVSVNSGLSEAAFGVVRSVVSRTSFIPARLNNQAVPSKVAIEIEIKEREKPQ